MRRGWAPNPWVDRMSSGVAVALSLCLSVGLLFSLSDAFTQDSVLYLEPNLDNDCSDTVKY